MKPTKHQTEQKIEEILSYLLCHNMSDIDSKKRGSHLDSIRPLR